MMLDYDQDKADEIGRKLCGMLLLLSVRWSVRIIVPSEDEWIGLNLLDRDGETPEFARLNHD